MKKSFTQILTIELGKLFAPLKTLNSQEGVIAFFKELGYDIPVAESLTLYNTFESIDLVVEVQQLLALIDSAASIQDQSDLLPVVDQVKDYAIKVNNLIKDVIPVVKSTLNALDDIEALPKRLADYLTFKYLEVNYYKIFAFGHVLGIFEWVETDGKLIKTVQWNRIGLLFSKPIRLFEDTYEWGLVSFDDEEFLNRFSLLLQAFMLPGGVYTQESGLRDFLDPTHTASGKEIRMPLYNAGEWPDTYLEAGINLSGVTKDNGTGDLPGMFFYPNLVGGVQIDDNISPEWSIELTANADLTAGVGLEIRPPARLSIQTDLFSSPGIGEAKIGLKIKNKPAGQDAVTYLIGDETGSNLSVETAEFYLFAERKGADSNFGAELSLKQLTLIIQKDDGDGFISKVIPEAGFKAALDLGLGYSLNKGFYFLEGNSLKITIPIHKKIGPLEIEDIVLEFEPEENVLQLALGTTFELKIGPLWARVEEIGLKAEITFDPENGGAPELDVKFKPPTGIGLSIDTQGFSGGGYLYIGDYRYAGIINLNFSGKLNLTAITIITTRLPNGEKGFSLLIVVTAEGFGAIPIGFGFNLIGVGGLMALNRSMYTDVLREGIKTGTAERLLFPQNPLENAEQIISDLEAVFPIVKDQFVIAPMAKLSWGSGSSLLTADLGLFIELFHPFKLVILGVVRVAIGTDEENSPILLKVSFMGEFNPEKKWISFDATLFGSRLMKFTLEGDMAFRLVYGDKPNFVVSLGGFHPAYQPPPLQLANMKRLTVSILRDDNAEVAMESYFALTSNSVQVGAVVYAKFKAMSYDVKGILGFDALIEFNPFRFIFEVTAGFGLYKNGKEKASVGVYLKLTGPAPWNVCGTASAKLLGMKFKFDFNKTFGEANNVSLPDVDVRPLFVIELDKNENWLALPAPNINPLVKTRSPGTSGDMILDPFGALSISQKILPTKTTLQKFGSQNVVGALWFDISKVVLGNLEMLNFTEVLEDFAPAQFQNLSDGQKLSSPSFKKFPAGIKVTDTDAAQLGTVVKKDVTYELILLEEQENIILGSNPPIVSLDAQWMNALRKNNAAGRSSLSLKLKSKKQVSDMKVFIRVEPYRIVYSANLNPYDAYIYSETRAAEALLQVIRANPAMEEVLQVVPDYEADIAAMVAEPISGYENLTHKKPSTALFKLPKKIIQ